MKLTGYVYDSDEVDSQPDHNEFMFQLPNGRQRYVKVGHNLLAHDRGELIAIDGGKYVVGDVEYSYSPMPSESEDYELTFVTVVLEEVK